MFKKQLDVLEIFIQNIQKTIKHVWKDSSVLVLSHKKLFYFKIFSYQAEQNWKELP